MNKKKLDIIPAFGKAGKMGTYTIVMSVILLAAIVIVNVIVGMLPTKYTKIDISQNKMFTLSDTSVNFVSKLDEKVTFYYILQNGTENSMMDTFLGRFTDLSSNIKLKVIDPIDDPTFLEDYSASGCSNYSVIVSSEKRSKVVDYSDLYYYYSESYGKMSVDEYQSALSYYGDYLEMYLGTITEFFDGDNALTGAIEYVTAEKVPTVYTLEGHSEQEFTDVVTQNLFDYSEIKYSTLNIALSEKEIPDDADVIIIFNPASDLTAEEAEKLNKYVDGGGKILLITSATSATFTNLSKVAANMGMSPVASLVYEGDRNYYSQTPLYIFPTVNSSHEATSAFATSGYSAIMPYAHGIEVTGATGVTVTSLLTTSEKAYVDESEKKSYTLAACAEKGDGKLVWIASAQSLTDSFIYGTNGGNFYVLSTMFSWMQGEYQSELPTISGIDLSETYLTVPEGSANLWGTVLIFVIPGAILGGGLIYWILRRKK